MGLKMPKTVKIRCQPIPKPSKTDYKKLLSDLGKATRRGLRKCPNCGFLNGTRGNMCKNSLCNMIFKDSEKRKVQSDSVKLITGTSRQIYSVRVQDKELEDRGFVQLPFYENGEKNLLSEVALCFVDSCQRLFDDSILKCHENEVNNTSTICVHIESALKSFHVATPLEFKHDLINNLNVEDDIKKKLCSLAKSTEGPVVQRVSKSVMAVKCSVTSTNPLGYLHLNLYSSKGDNLEEIDHFYCSCSDTMMHIRDFKGDRELSLKCLHYYACICAFASDSKLSNKFLHLIQNEFDPLLIPNYEFNLVNMLDTDIEESVPILTKDTILEFSDVNTVSSQESHIEIEVLPTDLIFEPEKLECDISTVPNPHENRQRAKLRKEKKIQVKKKKCVKKKITPEPNYSHILTFNEWLTSVTERINLLDSCEGNRRYEQLTFHIPNKFFDLLKERICFGTKLQPTTQNIIRNTAPPIGSFTQTSYIISNILHLKHIFDTDKISLNISKKNSVVNFMTYVKSTNCLKPKKTNGIFIIEWIEDLFPVSKFGQLNLQFVDKNNK